jgi:hypothetical protein
VTAIRPSASAGNAASYRHTWRSDPRPSGSPQPPREAATSSTPAQLIEQFAVTGPQAIATAQLGPVVVDYFRLAMLPLQEAVSIGILEATVQLLDLQLATGRREVALFTLLR